MSNDYTTADRKPVASPPPVLGPNEVKALPGLTVFGIARTSRQVYGHGDSGDEQKLERTGSYGTGEFHPLFVNEVDAATYLCSIPYNHNLAVVPLTLKHRGIVRGGQ